MKSIGHHIALSRIASIEGGLALRSAAPIKENGEVKILQPGALMGEKYVERENLPSCDIEKVPARVLLVPGDVIFLGRGQPKCSVFKGGAGRTILAAPLFRIRPRSAEVRPEFLALHMVSMVARAALQRAMRGSAARFIGRSDLEALEITIPPIERQDRILEISSLADREAVLSARLAQLRAVAIDALLADRSTSQLVPSKI